MNISDQAIIISVSAFQENGAVVVVFSREHGVQSGFVNNIKSSKNANIYIPGNLVDFSWNARLVSHMGSIKCELIRAYGSIAMYNKLQLYALSSILSLIHAALKPSEKYTDLFDVIHNYISKSVFSFEEYIKTELFILQEVGYRLDFSECAATGIKSDLIYVSPKTGRAVSRGAGLPYKHLLLKLPEFLVLEGKNLCERQKCEALDLTGYFLKRHVLVSGKDTMAREIFREAVTL